VLLEAHRTGSRQIGMRSLVRSDRGVTLVELLMATGLMLVILGSAVSVLTSVLNSQPKMSRRDYNLQKARSALNQMTREVRQGLAVDQATTSTMAVRTYTRRVVCGGTATLPASSPATLCRVTYSCSAGTCTRTEAQPNGSGAGSAVKVIQGLSSNSVFSYSPSTAAATYVRANLVLPNPSGGGSLTIGDGASLRNATLTN
jgi:type II secretory pathway pseudopilin PulG